MRLAVYGSGVQAQAHIAALKRLRGVEIAAMLVREASQDLGAKFGVPTTTDAAAILADASVQAVVIATPTATRPEFACAALAAGKHVFCETPIAHTLEDAERMRAAAERAGRVLQIGFIHRFEKQLPRLFDEVSSGRHGRVIGIESERLSAFVADGMAKPHHGDAIDELLAFDLHNLGWGFGRPRAITADGVRGRDGFDEVNALVAFYGFTARCLATNRMPRGHAFVERLRIRCERAVLLSEAVFEASSVSARLIIEGGEELAVEANDPMRDQMAHFIAVVRGAPCAVNATLARDVLALVLAARRAAETGSAVQLD